MSEPTWQKSSFSEDQVNCIYVAPALDGTIHLRESEEPRTVLTSAPQGLTALLRHLKAEPPTPV
ncbi:hypothetical protein QF035_005730 [Streptomyces umbrinus]|uniref:DUF397 domain-containing protein n=1 Tax=Streptomyces umbrinus TaxID=67370 RepID=A0ABU0SXJ4_9ACTN|nr:DUF397 domain-containing protein [Streptomyces umbrinus]MDQ1028148.1 hypothetical protein [Streptomyces umbrinus]